MKSQQEIVQQENARVYARSLVETIDKELKDLNNLKHIFIKTGCVEKDIAPIIQSLKTARMAANNVLLMYGDRSMSGRES